MSVNEQRRPITSRRLERGGSDRLWLGRESPASIAGVDGSGRFDQQDRRFFLGARAVLDATRNDEQFALVEFDVAITQLDCQVSFEDDEEVIGVVVLVPDELAFDLDDPNIVVVDASDDLRLPVLIEEAQLRQVDLVRDLLLLGHRPFQVGVRLKALFTRVLECVRSQVLGRARQLSSGDQQRCSHAR